MTDNLLETVAAVRYAAERYPGLDLSAPAVTEHGHRLTVEDALRSAAAYAFACVACSHDDTDTSTRFRGLVECVRCGAILDSAPEERDDRTYDRADSGYAPINPGEWEGDR